MNQARQQMTMRATVTRPGGAVSDGQDEWGGEVHDDAPDAWLDDLPCLAWTPGELKEVLDDTKLGVFGAVRLSVPTDTEIRERDIIDEITDRRGNVLFPGPLKVTGVSRKATHLAVMTRTQDSLKGSG